MKSCGKRFHSEVGKFRFLNELIKVVSPKVGLRYESPCYIFHVLGVECYSLRGCPHPLPLVSGLTVPRACKKEGVGVDL